MLQAIPCSRQYKQAQKSTDFSAIVCLKKAALILHTVTQKNGNFLKTQQELKKSKKRNLLTEIEPLQLAF